MKTTVGKILSVVTAVASVIFLGFVLVATLGGPNWDAEAHSIEGFSIAPSDAQPKQWTATRHVGEGAINPNKAIEPVLVAVYDDRIKTANDEAGKLQAQEGPLDAAIAESKAATTTDVTALQDQIDELENQLDQTKTEALASAEQVEAKAEEVRKIELQIQSRREDVLRLSAQVEEIRADRFRIREVQQQLQDLIQQIDGSLERAAERLQQLKEQG